MLRMNRNERIAAITGILTSNPNTIFTLSYFSELFNTAKSTISEDAALLRDTFQKFGLGDIETVPGAAGGIKFIPQPVYQQAAAFVKDLCRRLSDPDRILPGGFLYMNDIIYMPRILKQIGDIFASRFLGKKPDFVITVETRGIPVAIMTAHSLGCPVVVARREGNVTEGSLVSINYVTASSKRLQTMSLSRRAVQKGGRALIIDDFMKGGGTAKGMQELLKEFDVEIAGVGVVIATREPEVKLISEYTSLMELLTVDESGRKIEIVPADWLNQ
ncbi:MAG TPA: pur operon repressor [Candidatus Atribacteria bacterium]|nr:pur operon repressor [Candidatus Atribacteria bacterium]